MDEYLDSRFMSKDFLRGFVDVYKKNVALWKIGTKEYTNKHLKEKGYKELVEYCKDICPHATKDFVRKRVQNMRGCFRKEYKKVIGAHNKNEVYEPKLWYYDLFLFTKDLKNDENDGQEALENDENFVKMEIYSDDEFVEDDSEHAAESQLSMISGPVSTIPQNTPPTNLLVAENRKRRYPTRENPEYKTTHNICASQNSFFQDEFDAIGVNVAAKLRSMDSTQQILAESLINQVIFKGKFRELTRSTRIVESIDSMVKLEGATNKAATNESNTFNNISSKF